jgi:hypothetical protein
MHPYIGVTDFKHISQVERMLRALESTGSRRKLHVGVMTSRKILDEEETIWKDAFPRPEDIAGIMGSTNAYNCLHYVEYNDQTDLLTHVRRAIALCGPSLHAVQLDATWPSTDVTWELHREFPHLEIIIQVGRLAQALVNNSEGIARMLHGYGSTIHRALIDNSQGRGVKLNTRHHLAIIAAIKRRMPRLGLVTAGGLGPGNLDPILPIIERHPNTSIDAQAGLRPSKNALDPINLDMTEAYIIEAGTRLP